MIRDVRVKCIDKMTLVSNLNLDLTPKWESIPRNC